MTPLHAGQMVCLARMSRRSGQAYPRAGSASSRSRYERDRQPAVYRPDGRTTYGDGQVTVPLMVLSIPDEPSSVGTFANVAVTVAPETVATSWPPVA